MKGYNCGKQPFDSRSSLRAGASNASNDSNASKEDMENYFNKVAIIGAGTMGAQIAALIAGTGCDVELLDRSAKAEQALKNMAMVMPPALFSKKDAGRIRAGNIDEHIDRISDCDWVLETLWKSLKQNELCLKK
ncbi:MAG: 3-hydroxyacyl-CoA dehydrogenase NAD-binding domain-containing protein [Pseudomonadota bacterium]